MKLCFEADVYRFGSKRIAPEFYDPRRSYLLHMYRLVVRGSTYITFCILVRIQMVPKMHLFSFEQNCFQLIVYSPDIKLK